MSQQLSRRRLLGAGLAGGAGAVLARPGQAQIDVPSPEWTIALNASTIRPASLDDKIRAAETAGYQGIELWSNELTDHEKAGGSLEALRQRLGDAGLSVPNIIGLWNAMPADDAERPAALDRVRGQIEQAARVGAAHIATVPAPDRRDFDLRWAGERYREIMAIGEELGVIPAVEFIGFFQGVSRLAQAIAIAVESDHPQACIVADTFHLYRGGSGFNGVRQLAGSAIACFHINDAPATPAQAEQGDEHRVMPGEGVLPLVQLIRNLQGIGFHGPLSLELFNRALWEQDPVEVAKLGMQKVRAVIEQAEAPEA